MMGELDYWIVYDPLIRIGEFAPFLDINSTRESLSRSFIVVKIYVALSRHLNTQYTYTYITLRGVY